MIDLKVRRKAVNLSGLSGNYLTVRHNKFPVSAPFNGRLCLDTLLGLVKFLAEFINQIENFSSFRFLNNNKVFCLYIYF